MQLKNNITFAHGDLSKVAPRYNEDLIITTEQHLEARRKHSKICGNEPCML